MTIYIENVKNIYDNINIFVLHKNNDRHTCYFL